VGRESLLRGRTKYDTMGKEEKKKGKSNQSQSERPNKTKQVKNELIVGDNRKRNKSFWSDRSRK